MAAASHSNILIDPDGDLVLLLGRMPFESSIVLYQVNAAAISPFGDAKSLSNRKAFDSADGSKTKSTRLYKFHLLVSSKHMSLASPVFKAMLTGGFKEAVELREKGKTEISLPDDDIDAMVTVVKVIHGRFKSIPMPPNLHILKEIAILVDKYQCHESVDSLKCAWTNRFHANTWGRENFYALACWTCVTWVLGLDYKFMQATEEIIKGSKVGLREILKENQLVLPIPEVVIDKIDKRREEALSRLVKCLGDKISQYQGPIDMCDSLKLSNFSYISCNREDCDSMVLGGLVRSARKEGLFPLPKAPFDNSLRFRDLKVTIASLKVQKACIVSMQEIFCDHGVIADLERSLEDVDKKISGLSLKDCK